MFEIKDLTECLSEDWLQSSFSKLERNLLLSRLSLPQEALSSTEITRLKRFSQAVIASAAQWEDIRIREARTLCERAGDIEATLADSAGEGTQEKHLSLLKALVLYELAGLPGASASHATRNGFDPRFREFFTRAPTSVWGRMTSHYDGRALSTDQADLLEQGINTLFSHVLGELSQEAGLRLQTHITEKPVIAVVRSLADYASIYELPVSGDDLHAIAKLIELRNNSGTLSVIRKRTALTEDEMRELSLPLELWPAQVTAIESGLLSQSNRSFGFAAPTGTGKTSLTRLLIADCLERYPDKKVLYICPTRALVRQVADDLKDALKGIGLSVVEVGAHLTVHDQLPLSPDNADVLVFTPERADLLLRVDPEFLEEVRLVVVDEAHHIEQPSRGVLLEFYLWRVRQMIPDDARVVQLSAVAPNIDELTDWLALDHSGKSVMVDWRANRLRVGALKRGAKGEALLSFGDSEPYNLLGEERLPSNTVEGLAKLADHLSGHGIVLVLCTSTGSAEKVAKAICDLRPGAVQDTSDSVSVKLDAWIERELYPEADLRNFYKHRVIYHHAKIPPRVRDGLEEAIRHKKVDVICATTTLAEGVNFPFSTVLVESLVGKSYQISPRALWNIAGRAGRFGVDTEGHCILFRPDTWEKRLKNYSLSEYFKSSLPDIPPVRSALANGILSLEHLIKAGMLDEDSLSKISLSGILVDGKKTALAKEIRALVNIMRVGYAHAGSSNIISIKDPETPEFDGDLLASRQMPLESKDFARHFAEQQKKIVRIATEDNKEFMDIAARVGWSLETQYLIHNWVQTREDWQLEQFGNIVVGGRILRFDRLGYLIGPLAKHLLAFEGTPLGGLMAFTAQKWIEGIPLSAMGESRGSQFAQLVTDIYGRIQFLLPWGLFGLHELVEYEAKQRLITVGTGIRDLSVLAAEGVPDFDSLQLVQIGIERVDASRLAQRYHKLGTTTDILGWFKQTAWPEVERTVRGIDDRRLDPNLRLIHQLMQKQETTEN